MDALWASSPFHILLGLAALFPVVLWDWRIAFPGLLAIQFGTSALIGTVYGLPGPWPTVHFGIQVLACIILLLSVLQTSNVQVRSSGEFSSRLFRLLVLGIAGLMVWKASEAIELPVLSTATQALFLWLAAVALITLALTETALFGGLGLLLWLIPVQAFLSVLFPIPAVIVILGVMQILVALACSYMLLAEDDALTLVELAATDPEVTPSVQPRHTIASGARVLGYEFGYWFFSLISRFRNPGPRSE